MQKTAIAKITAKITTTALLLFLALFTLTTNLKAQESGQTRKQGWFVGVVPIFWELKSKLPQKTPLLQKDTQKVPEL